MIGTGTFIYLAQTTLAVSFLIALVLLVRGPFAKAFGAKAAYALWAVPVLRLVLPPLPANWTLFGWLGMDRSGNAEPSHLLIDPSGFVEPGFAEPGLVANPTGSGEVVYDLTATPGPDVFGGMMDLLAGSGPVLAGLWLCGAGFVLALLALRQWQTMRLIKAEGHEVSAAVETSLRRICLLLGFRAGSKPVVQTSLISSGPLVTGLVQPVVLLPAWFETDYTPEEQRLALTHEVMHVKRRDLWALSVAWIGLALQWFNPLAWVAMAAFRADQEAACDADVLARGNTSVHAYGETLVKAVRISCPVAQPVHAASLPLNHALYERLSHMKNPLPTAKQRLTGSALMASVGAIALVASACASSAAQTTELSGGPDGDAQEQLFVLVDPNVDGAHGEDGGNGHNRITVESHRTDGATGLNRVYVHSTDDRGIIHSGLDGEAVFVTEIGDGAHGELVREFTNELERLQLTEGDHEAEIEALEEEFEARIEALAEAEGRHASVRFLSVDGDTHRAEDGGHVNCSEGSVTTQTSVFVTEDGNQERTTRKSCIGEIEFDREEILSELRESGELSEERLAEVEQKLVRAEREIAAARENAAVAVVRVRQQNIDFRPAEIMARLRENKQLSEEQLAEIERDLLEAKADLAEAQKDLEEMDFDFDFDFDEDFEVDVND